MSKRAAYAIPFIDSSVRHIGATELRGMTLEKLEELHQLVIVHASDHRPLAVIVPFKRYIELQTAANKENK